MLEFQYPPSVRKATDGFLYVPPPVGISIPAFREEGDRDAPLQPLIQLQFQSPPSVRKATDPHPQVIPLQVNFNPRLP